jgi:hypothetical protein
MLVIDADFFMVAFYTWTKRDADVLTMEEIAGGAASQLSFIRL